MQNAKILTFASKYADFLAKTDVFLFLPHQLRTTSFKLSYFSMAALLMPS